MLDRDQTWYDGTDPTAGRLDYDADGDGHDSDAHGGDTATTHASIRPSATEIDGDGIDRRPAVDGGDPATGCSIPTRSDWALTRPTRTRMAMVSRMATRSPTGLTRSIPTPTMTASPTVRRSPGAPIPPAPIPMVTVSTTTPRSTPRAPTPPMATPMATCCLTATKSWCTKPIHAKRTRQRGRSDGDEVLTDGTDPRDPSDDLADTDGDGLTDVAETSEWEPTSTTPTPTTTAFPMAKKSTWARPAR